MEDSEDTKRCFGCKGKGRNTAPHLSPSSFTCPDCGGSGYQILCPECDDYVSPEEMGEYKCYNCEENEEEELEEEDS